MAKAQPLSTVISSNPYNNSYYEGTTTQISPASKPKFLKTQYSIASLKTSSFLTTQISVSKNIEEEDHYDVIENKTYEELGLDLATEYTIGFYELVEAQDEANRLFNVFVVDPVEVRDEFAPVVEQIKYIDHLYPAPLLLRSLYKKEIIVDSGIDCFIYFSDFDAFLTLYQDGEFLYTKELKFTLENIHELFCEVYGERVSLENFMTLFAEEGLRTTNEENREYLIKLFNEIFAQINEVINFTKRAYEIEEIKRVYIGTSAGVIHGMDEFSQVTLGIESHNFDFEYGFVTSEFYVDQMHQLMHLTAQLGTEDRYDVNFTFFDRPPPFVQRESGRLILLAAAALLTTSIYPLWNLGYTLFANLENESLKKEQRRVHDERVIIEGQVNAQVKLREELNKKISEALKTQQLQKSVLTQIHRQKVMYPMKAKIIADLTKDLNRYQVQLSAISYSDDTKVNTHTFILELVSVQERQITDMIEKLTKENLTSYKISIEEIAYNEEMDNYTSRMKVELR